MSIKQTIKYLLGWVQSARFGVADCGKGVYAGLGVKVDGGRRVHLGDNSRLMPSSMVVAHVGGHVYLGPNSEIGMYSRVASVGEVHISDDVMTGPHVFISDYNHEYADPELPIRLQGNRIVKTCDSPRGYPLVMGRGLALIRSLPKASRLESIASLVQIKSLQRIFLNVPLMWGLRLESSNVTTASFANGWMLPREVGDVA